MGADVQLSSQYSISSGDRVDICMLLLKRYLVMALERIN